MPGTLAGGLVVGVVETLVTRYLGSQYADLFCLCGAGPHFVRPARRPLRAGARAGGLTMKMWRSLRAAPS